jgi:hypothetical protein
MATPAENIATITAKAAELDDLVTQFRAARAIIDAAETEIRKAQPNANHEMVSGRVRLALYAHARMVDPIVNNGKTVAALSAEAWSGVS